MRSLNNLKYKRVWDEFDELFRFRPSVELFPGIEEPSESITFRLAENYDEAMLDELQTTILDALVECNAFSNEVYYLDWQHESYLIADPAKDAIWANGFPDGDYAVFLANGMSVGSFGHPWEYSICFFGNIFVKNILERRPRILGPVLRNKGGFAA